MIGPYAVVRDCLRAGEPVALATVVELAPEDNLAAEEIPTLGAKLVVRPDVSPSGSLGNPGLDKTVARDASAALETGRSAIRHYGVHGEPNRIDLTIFLEVFAPPRQMVIFGAVDFTGALVRVASVLGYQVTVCDARAAFATAVRFPEADQIVVDWPHRYLAKVADQLGASDAVCVLTHDHKFDVPAIVAALATNVGYLGALGSRRTHAARVDRLREAGVDDAGLARIMAPIGIDIGARSPEETALSICAEIVALRSGVPTMSLQRGTGPIHRTPL
jgi:xanthine dehydrogenase accessory factor